MFITVSDEPFRSGCGCDGRQRSFFFFLSHSFPIHTGFMYGYVYGDQFYGTISTARRIDLETVKKSRFICHALFI